MTHSRARNCQKQSESKLMAGRLFNSLLNASRYVIKRIKFTRQISNERHTLDHLSDYQLRDIGLTRDQAKVEVNRGVFDTPSARFCQFGYRQQGQREPKHRKIHRIPKD